MSIFNRKNYFFTALAALILAEIVALSAFWAGGAWESAAWGAAILAVLILSLVNLKCGVYAALGELFIGSQGYLLALNLGGVSISLRIGIFIVVMGVWGAKMLVSALGGSLKVNKVGSGESFPPPSPVMAGGLRRAKENYFSIRHTKIFKYYILLGAVLAWGFVWGLIRGNSFSNAFFDFNGWIYFLYVLPMWDVFTTTTPSYLPLKKGEIEHSQILSKLPHRKWETEIRVVLSILTAAAVVIFAKTLICVFWFTQGWPGADWLYKFIRDTKIGEITYAGQGNDSLWRIFFQAQIYCLVALIVAYAQLILNWDMSPPPSPATAGGLRRAKKEIIFWFVILFCAAFPVVVSLSRSFWVGGLAAFVACSLYLVIYRRDCLKKFLIITAATLIIVVAQYQFFIFLAGGESGSLISSRIKDAAVDAAGASRMNQLRPLTTAIIKHPIVGSGFGTTVSYQSKDPRILKTSPDGRTTTYAFEWGYLDIMLKMGLAGLAVYLLLIWQAVKKLLITNDKLLIGIILGFIAIMATSVFSPYMNHPLGIGWVIIVSVIANVSKSDANKSE